MQSIENIKTFTVQILHHIQNEQINVCLVATETPGAHTDDVLASAAAQHSYSTLLCHYRATHACHSRPGPQEDNGQGLQFGA